MVQEGEGRGRQGPSCISPFCRPGPQARPLLPSKKIHPIGSASTFAGEMNVALSLMRPARKRIRAWNEEREVNVIFAEWVMNGPACTWFLWVAL